MAGPDIFLSYNREDASVARRYAEAFGGEGFEVWWDAALRSGEAYDEVTEKALSEAKAVVVLWSPRSVGSRWVRAEATEANRNKTLVPAMIEPCRRPIMFELIHTAELMHWDGDPKDPAWQTFLADVRKRVGRDDDSAAAVPPPSASLSPSPAPVPGLGAAWAKIRSHRWAAALAALLVVLAGAWTLFGPGLSPGSGERIPVVVRQLTAPTTGDATEAALAGGITDELISRLRRLPDLRVATAAPDGIAPSGAFDNAYVVDGTIRSSGDRLQVNVRLSDAQGEVLWSDTLDRDIADLFDMQEEIAAAIAGSLSVSFDVGANSVAYGGTDNPEAYAAYMQYWKHSLGFDGSAQRYLERAVALDPDFGRATAQLATNYGNLISFAATSEQAGELLARMDEASARALAENPELWFGQAARGWYLLSKRDFAAAERQMRRAAKLDPGDHPELRDALATYALHVGRLEKSIAIRDSRELIDPIYRSDPWNVFDLMMTGNYEEAIEFFDRLSRYEERNLQGFAFHAYFAYLLVGREDDAAKFAERVGRPDFAERLRALRANKALPTMSGRQLRQWVKENLPGGGHQVAVSAAAMMAAHAGHERLAVDLLRIAYERPGGFALFYLWHPAMAEARKTDEFEQLVIDLGLVKAWRESGDWGDYCRPVSAREIACT